MGIVLAVLVVLVIVVVVAGLALGPSLRKKGDAAVARCKEVLGADQIKLIEPKANGFGTEPATAGGLRGMGCLAMNDTELMFVTWAPQKEFRVARSAISSVATSADDLPRVLGVFERVRAQRAGQMQQASLINGTLWHFSDGPEQEARDLAMQPEVLGQPFEESPNQWSDPVTQEWAYGYDAVEAIAAELRSSASAGLAKL